MNNVKKSSRLQLNRESLRTLGQAELDQVAGATGEKCISILTLTRPGTASAMGLCGGPGPSALCASVFCGSGVICNGKL